MEGFIQVVTATDKREDAEPIARSLVEMRLAGCVQIVGPVTSIYHPLGYCKGSIMKAFLK